MRTAWCGQRGVGAVLGVGGIGVLATVAVLGAGFGGVVVDQHRVAAAADLAALAGAVAHQSGEDACAAARDVARRNDARLSECGVAGGDVVVRAVRPARSLFGHAVVVGSQARAGPVPPLPP